MVLLLTCQRDRKGRIKTLRELEFRGPRLHFRPPGPESVRALTGRTCVPWIAVPFMDSSFDIRHTSNASEALLNRTSTVSMSRETWRVKGVPTGRK